MLKNRFFWIGLLAVSIVSALLYAIFFSPLFEVEQVQVRGTQKASAEDIRELATQLIPRVFLFFRVNNLFLLDSAGIGEGVERMFPALESVSVRKKFPASIVLTVKERTKVAVWCREKIYIVETSEAVSGKEGSFQLCFSVDEKGVIFEEIEKNDQVAIFLPDNQAEAELGDAIIEEGLLGVILDFQKELDAFDLFEGIGLRVTSMKILSGEQMRLKISEGWEVYVNPVESMAWQMTKLKLVLEREVPSEKRAGLEYIDLRFGDQAYIKYR